MAINEIIDDILKAESEADAIIERAKEQAKSVYAANKTEIEQLYSQAETVLKAEVGQIITSAEAEAVKRYETELNSARSQTDSVIKLSKEKLPVAVKKIEAALMGK